jgi:hypothetical protein
MRKQFKYLGFNDMGKTTASTKEQCTIHNVVLSALEKMTFNEVEAELKEVKIELQCLEERKTALENEYFWKLNPKCRPH